MSFGIQSKTSDYHTNPKGLLKLVQKLKTEVPHLLLLDIFARENHNEETADFFLEYRFLDIDGLGNYLRAPSCLYKPPGYINRRCYFIRER